MPRKLGPKQVVEIRETFQMGFQVRILADSINWKGDRLTTFEVSFPRFILAEVETHGMLSFNGASSRAIPTDKFIDQVMNDPVIPVEWGKNQRGMVAEDTISDDDAKRAEAIWLGLREPVVAAVQELHKLKVHKQLANRPMEPWMWTTFILSATDWQNYFALRTAEDAQPEFRALALKMCELYFFGSQPIYRDRILHSGVQLWHLPLVTETERDNYHYAFRSNSIEPSIPILALVSAARCASISYLRQHDERPIDAWVEMCDNKLIAPGHMSPFEHVARVGGGASGNFTGWDQLRKMLPGENRRFTVEDAKRVLGR